MKASFALAARSDAIVQNLPENNNFLGLGVTVISVYKQKARMYNNTVLLYLSQK